MNNITVIGIDLAKNVFQVHAEDAHGNKVFNRQLKRAKFIEWMNKLAPCLIGMEACGTAHHWGREFLKRGHEVKLINPRKIKAFLDRNKNDERDAEAICDATRSKKVLGIPVKSLPQQNLTSLHRARSQVVGRQTQLANHLRSQLAEYGLVTKKGHASLITLVKEVLSGEKITLSRSLIFVISDLFEDLQNLMKRVEGYNLQLAAIAKENKSAQKLMEIPGIKEITSTAIIAKVEDFNAFKKGRDFAAWLGLTPREHSSAGKQRLGGITKQGDRYIRTLLIHGARAVVAATIKKGRCETAYHRWILSVAERRGKNKAAVALANKHARMIWAMMKHDRKLDLHFAEQFCVAA